MLPLFLLSRTCVLQTHLVYFWCNCAFISYRTILHEFTEQSDKVVDLGKSLLEAAAAIIRENEENAKRLKEKQKEKVVVYDGKYTIGL